MLRVVGKRGLCCPVITCDWCGRPIEDARQGNYEWVFGPEGDSTAYTARMASGETLTAEVFFTHKRCCHAFEMANNRGSGVLWGAFGLECLPVYLGANLALRWREARATARLLAHL